MMNTRVSLPSEEAARKSVPPRASLLEMFLGCSYKSSYCMR
jgi:hypothetical protein